MSVKAVSSIEFLGNKPQASKKNKNNSHLGSYVGMGVGTVAGGFCGVRTVNNIKKSFSLKKFLLSHFNFGFTGMGQYVSVSDVLKDVDLSRKAFRKERYRVVSKNVKVIPFVLAALGLLAGLGVGAVADKIIDYSKSKKSDK